MNEHRFDEAAKKKLIRVLERFDSLLIAFSGGVDSTLLLAVAKEVLGDRVACVTAASAVHSERELKHASEIAAMLGVKRIVRKPDIMGSRRFLDNTEERCRICKQIMFADFRQAAVDIGIDEIAHGVNTDDLKDYRPGIAAATEMGIHAPLVDAGFDKQMVRALARHMQLPNWDKPAMACLATRIPFGTPVRSEILKKIQAAESVLLDSGFHTCRVRHHGDIARIEIDQDEFGRLAGPGLRERIASRLKALGYRYITVDIQGYVQGSLNPPA